jgi:hypothetical protein
MDTFLYCIKCINLYILLNILFILGKDEAEELLRKVNDAVALLTDYNTRLVCEMEDRKKVSSMLHDFIQSQRDLIDQAEQRLQVICITFNIFVRS